MIKWGSRSIEEKIREYDKILKEIDHKLTLEINDRLDAYDAIIAELGEK